MARYLVTGGAGFIGSHLCAALVAEGHAVRVLDDLSTGKPENLPPGADLLRGCITDAALVRRAMEGVDGCFHLAAIASVQRGVEDWPGTHRVNQSGSVNVLDAARPARVPLVYASSAAVYGDCAELPIRESAPARPLSAYGADKLGSELHAAVGTHVFGIPTAGLRFFNVYGERQDPASPYSGVISIFANRIPRGVPITIFGDGEQTRDFVYVADVAAALRAAMRRLEAGPAVALVFNICSGTATSVRGLAETIGAICGQAPQITNGPPRAGEIRHSLGARDAAVAELGLATPTPLAEGLARLLAAGG
jgi:UDP-glucose 4-epimerase